MAACVAAGCCGCWLQSLPAACCMRCWCEAERVRASRRRQWRAGCGGGYGAMHHDRRGMDRSIGRSTRCRVPARRCRVPAGVPVRERTALLSLRLYLLVDILSGSTGGGLPNEGVAVRSSRAPRGGQPFVPNFLRCGGRCGLENGGRSPPWEPHVCGGRGRGTANHVPPPPDGDAQRELARWCGAAKNGSQWPAGRRHGRGVRRQPRAR
jgi:hypothetical protein